MNRVRNNNHPSPVSPLSAPGAASMVNIVIRWLRSGSLKEPACASSKDAFSYGLITASYTTTRHGFAVRFLLRRIETVSVGVHCQGVQFFLNRKILQLAVVIGVVHLEYRYSSARAGHVDSLDSRIKFDDIRATSHRKERDGLVSVEIKDRHQVLAFAGEEGTMMLWVKGHPVIPFAPPHRIAAYDFIRGRIDDREDIFVLEVYVNLLCDGIVLWHSRFTVEVECLNDIICADVYDGFRFASFI